MQGVGGICDRVRFGCFGNGSSELIPEFVIGAAKTEA